MSNNMPSISKEFLSISTYSFKDKYDNIKDKIIECCKNNHYDYDLRNKYVIELSNKLTTVNVSFFKHEPDEVLLELTRRSGCAMSCIHIFRNILSSFDDMMFTQLV